ncbi:MAG: O-antigen ligase C-terminal domain-containing protein [Porticoccaceae bacterium]|nr:O-antigen ligase C-terminal domain-containing protein [Porticoccaceae bacterium]
MIKNISVVTDKLSAYLYLCFGLCVVLAWLLPNHYYPWTAFYNEFVAALGFVSLGITVFWLQPGRLLTMDSVPWIVLVLAALICVPLLQYGVGKIYFLGDAVMAALYLGGLTLVYVLGGILAHEPPKKDWGISEIVACLLLVGAFLSFVIAAGQWASIWEGLWFMTIPMGSRAHANLGQPNNLATLLFLGLMSAVYLRERGKLGGALTWVFVVLLMAGIAMARSRTSILVMVFVAGWLMWQPQRLSLKCTRLQVCCAVALFLGLVFVLPLVTEWFYHGLGSESVVSRRGAVRLNVWPQLLDAALREPLFGYGWNQVIIALVAVVDDYDISSQFAHSHSIVLDLLIWNGVVLGGLLLLLMAWWVLSRFWSCRDVESWYGLAAIGVVGIHALVEFPLEYAYFLLPVGLFAGIIDSRSSIKKITVPRLVFSIALLVGVVLMSRVFLEYKTQEDNSRQMRFEARGIHVPRDERPIVLLTQLAGFERFVRTDANENMSEAEIEAMGRVAHRYPFPPFLFQYARVLGINGRYEEAELEMLRLKILHGPQQYENAAQGLKSLASEHPQLSNVTLSE